MKDTNKYYPLQQLGYREDYAITLQGDIVETANKQPIRKGKGERYKLTTADGKSVYRAIIRQTLLKIQMARHGNLSTAEERITSATEGELRAFRESGHGY